MYLTSGQPMPNSMTNEGESLNVDAETPGHSSEIECLEPEVCEIECLEPEVCEILNERSADFAVACKYKRCHKMHGHKGWKLKHKKWRKHIKLPKHTRMHKRRFSSESESSGHSHECFRPKACYKRKRCSVLEDRYWHHHGPRHHGHRHYGHDHHHHGGHHHHH